ncbi:hypothetical protein WMY93_017780 [Mugilogobius chulae]|uniref:ribonuclease H n=1 Tax=Mugilogobius chulae TaxID=88201 RepID=A0AAW0NQC7_9GOBI
MLKNINQGYTDTLKPQALVQDPLSPIEGAVAPQMDQTDALGPLAQHITQWHSCGASNWVLKTVTRGYRLQFASVPPKFNGVLLSQPREEEAPILQKEIESLKDKGAIRIVPVEHCQTGFYSRYFLVPKKGGGRRPIMDLRALNKYMRTYTFRMLTHATLLRFVRQGDWFVSIDLKDAYFHIPIYPPHRKYLRFAFQGVTYEYTVLPFGLSLSPRVFVKCTEAAIAPLRHQGLRLAMYIDDWLLAAHSPQQLREHTELLLAHLTSLGFTINWEKSVLVPSQTVKFIGLRLNSVTYKAQLSVERIEAFSACLATFRRGALLHYRTCHRLLGLMASALVVIPLGRLYMRPFQKWVTAFHLDPARHAYKLVPVTAACVRALRPWRRQGFLSAGVPMGTVIARKVITTDASLRGWGATHEGRTVSGVWSSQMRLCHINYLELRAVYLALHHFLPLIKGQHVLVRTDNTTVVAYINKQGGLRSHQLHALSHSLILWADSHLLSLRATHVPGIMNRGADLLSRGIPRYKDWMLHNEGSGEETLAPPRSPSLAHHALDGGDIPAFVQPTVGSAVAQRPGVTGRRGDLSRSPGAPCFVGLAPERLNLSSMGLPDNVIDTIQSARAISTRNAYDGKWRAFEEWCANAGCIALQSPVPVILTFLQSLLDKGLAFSTIKVYLAAISACHIGFGDKTAGQHPLICSFMKGARRLRPVSKSLVAPWDLTTVLNALSHPPFEPLHQVDLKWLSIKTALLLALASAKRVSDIHALSVSTSCMQFIRGGSKVLLKPNPAFMPKVFNPTLSCLPIELSALSPLSDAEGHQQLHALCPVRALRVYVDKTASFRGTEQLFVSWAPPHRGKPLTKQRLSHWIVEAISVAYESSGLHPPAGLRAHSTRGMATSWAMFRGTSVEEICAAASWATPHTFARFYRLDVTGPSLSQNVLSVGSSPRMPM